MFRLTHISDIHLSPLPDPSYKELASKRITGYINWVRHRKKSMAGTALHDIVTDLLAHNPNHIAVTGDLVNLALNIEINNAENWLKTLGEPQNVSLVPGNHDAYVPGALDNICKKWAPWMSSDGSNPHDPANFPYLRRRGPLAIIGVCSAKATAPFMASGDFKKKQAEQLGQLLKQTGDEGLCRVILIHHPPVLGATTPHKRLFGIRRFQRVIQNYGAELVLHGHTHLETHYKISGPTSSVPVICVPSASQEYGAKKPAARYNIFDIEPNQQGWSCHWTERGIKDASGTIEHINERTLQLPFNINSQA